MNTTFDLSLPAGFLGRDASTSGEVDTCGPVSEEINLGGIPEDPKSLGDTDTIVQRLSGGTPLLTQQVQVPIQIVSLSLRSMEPLAVQCGRETQLWQVDVGLTPKQQQGQMVITQTSPNGGVANSTLPVQPRLTFTRVDDGSGQTKVLDAPAPDFLNAQGVPVRFGPCVAPALHVEDGNDPNPICYSQTTDGQKVLTIEQGLFARHGIFPAQPNLEHFQCYKLEKKKFKKRTVTLNDQFKNTRAQVKTRKDLCNPAKKNKEPFLNKRAHLTRYAINGKSINTTVATLNQFGSQRLLVKKPKLLMVPTEKQERGDKRKPIQTETDHFQCYSIETKSGIRSVNGKPKRVTLKDQFRKKGVKVKSPKWLCAPVDKNSEGLLHPVRHLLCYSLKAKKLSKRVTIRNQFENKGVRVKKPKELCVPTLKTVVQ